MLKFMMNRMSRANCKSYVLRERRRRDFLHVMILEDRLTPATFIVDNDGDNLGINPAPGANKGTSRQAIIDANATAGSDTIEFDTTFFNVSRTIFQSTDLPALSGDTFIFGTDFAEFGARFGLSI